MQIRAMAPLIAKGRAAGWIEILGDADYGEGEGMVTYMLLYPPLTKTDPGRTNARIDRAIEEKTLGDRPLRIVKG